jgi:hypothetical protein
MKLYLNQSLLSEDNIIPAGDYEVTVNSAAETIVLSNENGVWQLKAVERPRKMLLHEPRVDLRRVVDEPRWLLIVGLPPATEWVVSLQEATGS